MFACSFLPSYLPSSYSSFCFSILTVRSILLWSISVLCRLSPNLVPQNAVRSLQSMPNLLRRVSQGNSLNSSAGECPQPSAAFYFLVLFILLLLWVCFLLHSSILSFSSCSLTVSHLAPYQLLCSSSSRWNISFVLKMLSHVGKLFISSSAPNCVSHGNIFYFVSVYFQVFIDFLQFFSKSLHATEVAQTGQSFYRPVVTESH